MCNPLLSADGAACNGGLDEVSSLFSYGHVSTCQHCKFYQAQKIYTCFIFSILIFEAKPTQIDYIFSTVTRINTAVNRWGMNRAEIPKMLNFQLCVQPTLPLPVLRLPHFTKITLGNKAKSKRTIAAVPLFLQPEITKKPDAPKC